MNYFQGLNFTLDDRPEASDFSVGPVNSIQDKSGGLGFFFFLLFNSTSLSEEMMFKCSVCLSQISFITAEYRQKKIEYFSNEED